MSGFSCLPSLRGTLGHSLHWGLCSPRGIAATCGWLQAGPGPGGLLLPMRGPRQTLGLGPAVHSLRTSRPAAVLGFSYPWSHNHCAHLVSDGRLRERSQGGEDSSSSSAANFHGQTQLCLGASYSDSASLKGGAQLCRLGACSLECSVDQRVAVWHCG